MYESLDKYTIYFTRQLDESMINEFRRLIDESDCENHNAVFAIQNVFQTKTTFESVSSYEECHLLLWSLYQAFGEFELECCFVEEEHPVGCWYETELNFQVDSSGYFELEIETSLANDEDIPDEMIDDEEESEECLDKLTALDEVGKYLSAEGSMEKFTPDMLREMLSEISF